jgi:hypothetical protein
MNYPHGSDLLRSWKLNAFSMKIEKFYKDKILYRVYQGCYDLY